MDFVTHACIGALAGRACSPEGASRIELARAGLLGAVVALAPDADHVLEFAGAEAYFLQHRTASHSLLAVGLAAAAVAAWPAPSGRARLRRAGIALASLGTHLTLDLATPFGTGIFWPFSDARIAFDGLPIVAPLFMLASIAALVVATRGACGGTRKAAWLALLALGGLLGFETAVALRAARAAPGEVRLAIPQPLNPFAADVFTTIEFGSVVVHLRLGPGDRAAEFARRATRSRDEYELARLIEGGATEVSRRPFPGPAAIVAAHGIPPDLVARMRLPVVTATADTVVVYDAQFKAIHPEELPIRIVKDARGVRVEQMALGLQPLIWAVVLAATIAIGRRAIRHTRVAD